MTTPEATTESDTAPSNDMDLLVQLIRYRKLLVRSVVAAAVLTGLVAWIYPASWTARGTCNSIFLKQGGRQP